MQGQKRAQLCNRTSRARVVPSVLTYVWQHHQRARYGEMLMNGGDDKVSVLSDIFNLIMVQQGREEPRQAHNQRRRGVNT